MSEAQASAQAQEEKKSSKKSSKKSTALAKKESAAISTEVLDYGDDMGQGYDASTANDIQVPRINILQALSPQCQPVKEGGMEGAEPGLIINTSTQEISESFSFCIGAIEKCYNEWIPRKKGGGFVGRHELTSDLVKSERAKTPRGALILENGNELVETVYLYVIPLDKDGAPLGGFAVLDFTKTKLSAWRSFNTAIRSFTVPMGNGRKGPPPLYAHRVTATTRRQQNSQGVFYNYVLNPMFEATEDKSAMFVSLQPKASLGYQQAKELGELVKQGFAKVQHMENDEDYSARPQADDEDAPF